MASCLSERPGAVRGHADDIDSLDDASPADGHAGDTTDDGPEDLGGDAPISDDKAGYVLGDCERPMSEAITPRVIFSGNSNCGASVDYSERVVQDADTWAPIEAYLIDCYAAEPDIVLPALDFASEQVVVLGVESFQTCQVVLDEIVVLSGSTGPYVEIHVTDLSLGCETACAARFAYLVAIALPKALGTPTLCRRVDPGCP